MVSGKKKKKKQQTCPKAHKYDFKNYFRRKHDLVSKIVGQKEYEINGIKCLKILLRIWDLEQGPGFYS